MPYEEKNSKLKTCLPKTSMIEGDEKYKINL